eukprot:TRINITY_DN30380_c0_g2_i1.p1 TRINITY_DN30380_c0_g2~~TRINITY_DN30380_c0_g2_i1.p1  ORF type:complete len:511 (-),score=98.01 TRINITY_DN30380_c0_g2_i1:41-1573(-)
MQNTARAPNVSGKVVTNGATDSDEDDERYELREMRRRCLAISVGALLLLGAALAVLLPVDETDRRAAWRSQHTVFAHPDIKFVSLNEGFEMLESRRRAGLSPVHEQFKRLETFEDDAIYAAADEGPQIPPPESDEFKITVAKCALSVDQAVFALLSASLGAEAASRACVNRTAEDDLTCGSDIAGILSNVGWMTSYLFYAPAFCGFQDIVASWCGGDWAWFFANAGSMTSSALGAAVDCQHHNTTPIQPVTPRRLRWQQDAARSSEDPYALTEDMAWRLAELGTRKQVTIDDSMSVLQDVNDFMQQIRDRFKLDGKLSRRLAEMALKRPGGIPLETARRLASLGGQMDSLPDDSDDTLAQHLAGRLASGLYAETPESAVAGTMRRLAAQRSGRPHDIVNCAFNVHGAAILMSNEVFNGWSTHKVCGAITPDAPAEISGLCAAGVIGLANFGFSATSTASTLAGTCPQNGSSKAYCVGDVTGMASTVLSYGSWAGTINHDCKDAWNPEDSE